MTRGIENEEQQHSDVEVVSTSDCGSVTNLPDSEESDRLDSDGIVCMKEDDSAFNSLKKWFNSCIGTLAQYCTVVSAHKNMHSTPTAKARLLAFPIYLKATTHNRNGNPNVRSCWYASSRVESHRILKDGFHACGMLEDGGYFGFGLNLYSQQSATDSVLSSAADGDGLRHVVICRVILGNMEAVLPGSRQSFPSSEKFDSGVDNLQSPKRHIIWYPHVNTHVLPMYLVSFKLDFCSKGLQREPVRRPSSPWIPFEKLISVLHQTLSSSAMCLIKRNYSDYMEGKIRKAQFVQHLRRLAGDELLINAIRTTKEKAAVGAPPRNKAK